MKKKNKSKIILAIIMLILFILATTNIVFAVNTANDGNSVIASKEVNQKEEWKHTFELPKYDSNGKLIIYEIDEENIPENYTKKVDGHTITNTLNKHNYKVEYYYDNNKDESKTDTMNVFYGTKIANYTDKNKLGYKLEKTEGLGLVVGANEKDNIIRIYYTTERCNFSGTKTWKDDNNSLGLRPESYKLKLFSDGKYLTEKSFTTGTWEFTGLQKYDYTTGKEILYTIQEDEIDLENGDKYVSTINGTQVINTLTGTTQIEAQKIWDDNENANNTRPLNITLIIKKILNK